MRKECLNFCDRFANTSPSIPTSIYKIIRTQFSAFVTNSVYFLATSPKRSIFSVNSAKQFWT